MKPTRYFIPIINEIINVDTYESYIYIYIYIFTYMHTYIYIYMHTQNKHKKDRLGKVRICI